MPSPDNTELLLLVGRIDGKMDTLMNTTSGLTERVAKLEAWNMRLIGLAAGAGGSAGTGAYYLAKLLSPVLGHQ